MLCHDVADREACDIRLSETRGACDILSPRLVERATFVSPRLMERATHQKHETCARQMISALTCAVLLDDRLVKCTNSSRSVRVLLANIGPHRIVRKPVWLIVLRSQKERGKKTVNHVRDVRDVQLSTHSPQGALLPAHIHFCKTRTLEHVDVDRYDLIGVDECQFFDDLDTVVPSWLKKGKHILCQD